MSSTAPEIPTIHPVQGEADLAAARDLFLRYATWLQDDHGFSLAYQGLDAELAGLPGRYAPPRGAIYIARLPAGAAAGCAAFRPFDGETCEIKRLYVLPEARGHDLGARLVAAVLDGARVQGYRRAVLDTADFMHPAMALYKRFGFRENPKYYENPMVNVRYFGADL